MKLAFLLLVTSAVMALAQSTVKCSWDANPEANVTGYRVLYGTNSWQYGVTNTVLGRLNTSVTISNLPVGVTYFVVQAFAGNLSSAPSYEVMWTNAPPPVVPVPPSAPKGFKLSANVQAGATPRGPWTNLANLAVPIPEVNDQRFFRTRLLLEELP